MAQKRVWESDTASEEDEPLRNVISETKKVHQIENDDSETSSDEDLSLPKRRKPFSEKARGQNSSQSPDLQRRKSGSPIDGERRKNISQPGKSSVSGQVSPGREIVKPSPPKPIERVFQHNGVKKMTLEDGPVHLLPYENKYARGGFSVRVTQRGQFVGLVQAGQEVACRKLLSEGWKSELRYLGGGRSEIVMRNQ